MGHPNETEQWHWLPRVFFGSVLVSCLVFAGLVFSIFYNPFSTANLVLGLSVASGALLILGALIKYFATKTDLAGWKEYVENNHGWQTKLLVGICFSMAILCTLGLTLLTSGIGTGIPDFSGVIGELNVASIGSAISLLALGALGAFYIGYTTYRDCRSYNITTTNDESAFPVQEENEENEENDVNESDEEDDPDRPILIHNPTGQPGSNTSSDQHYPDRKCCF